MFRKKFNSQVVMIYQLNLNNFVQVGTNYFVMKVV